MSIAVSRAPDADRVATPRELFFDLAYVFAIGQLSHHLLEHLDLRIGAETAIMTLAVFTPGAWSRAGQTGSTRTGCPVRLLLVGLMFASLLERRRLVFGCCRGCPASEEPERLLRLGAGVRGVGHDGQAAVGGEL
jgi:hypothetical protein